MHNRIADREPAEWRSKETHGNAAWSLPKSSMHDLVRQVEKVVTDHPGAALFAALLTGATIAWWLKRR